MSESKEGVAASRRAARAQRRRKATRTEIIDAARDVVLRDGLAGFSLAALAEQLGLTKPALYYYFASKEALIFELLLREWVESAAEVQAAVEQAGSGSDAIERLMRTVFDRYRGRLDLFMLCYKPPLSNDLAGLIGPGELQRLRPVNDMLYAGAEARLRADQATGQFPAHRDPRRFAFTAHMAVIGLLNMLALADFSSDPLIHTDQDLIDDMCQTFRAAALPGGSR